MPAPTDYNDVAHRLVEFREKHPEGSLQQVGLQFLDFAGKSWVVYTAGAYRTPDDPCPGHGTAWEPVPGPTNFTRDSEVQNAETSAWGRAIMAALAADSKKGIASADEVRNRQQESKPDPEHEDALDELRAAIAEASNAGVIDQEKRHALLEFGRNSTEHARNALAKVKDAMVPAPAGGEDVPF